MSDETASWQHQVVADCARSQATEVRTEEHLEVIQEVEQQTPDNNLSAMRIYGFLLLCRDCRAELGSQWAAEVGDSISMHAAVLTDAQGEIAYYRRRYGFVPEDLHNVVSASSARLKTLRRARNWHFLDQQTVKFQNQGHPRADILAVKEEE